MARKRKVAYFYDSEFSTFYFGQNHPMKPHRLAMTHHLVLGYDLHKNMDVYRPRKASPSELCQFHSQDYIEFLSTVSPKNAESQTNLLKHYNLQEDCPVFEGMFDFCRLYAGASIEAAVKLNNDACDIAINWAGGLHHAKKSEASGFCYINDLVLSVLELLKYHARVLYVDIDVHHGDGVEEAFYLSDRVMTVSFHKYGDLFFPGTGSLKDTGEYNGRHYSVNVPFKDGTTDETFHNMFEPVMAKVMEVFRPGAIVMQCGADSLAHDRLGCFNLSLSGHGRAVSFMKKFGIPMLVTGGGGYTKHNVARCWTFETAILTDQQQTLSDRLPDTDYNEYFGPDYSLSVSAHKIMDNNNKPAEIERMKMEILENLRQLEHAPGVAFHDVPPDTFIPEYCLEDDGNPDERLGMYGHSHLMIKESDLYEDDHDNYGE